MPDGLERKAAIPFRKEVSVDDFETIERSRNRIDESLTIVESPADRPLGALLMQEMIVDPQVPNEAKPEAFKRAFDLISGYGYQAENVETAATLIDAIRGCPDKHIRIRLAAIASHAIQEKNIQREGQPLSETLDAIKRREAFEVLAQQEDITIGRQWAKFLLKPRGVLAVFNALYEKDPNIVFLPHIKEEETDIQDEALSEVEGPVEDTDVYDWVRLNPGRFYSQERRAKINEVLGKEPPLFITRVMGAQYVHVEFPQDLSEIVAGDVESFRMSGSPTREQIMHRWEVDMWPQFLARMNNEQRADFERDIANKNIAIDFRVATIRPAQNPAEPTAGPQKQSLTEEAA